MRHKRVARRLRKISKEFRDSDMDIEPCKECTGLHINYTRAHNTKQGISITAVTIDDFRRLNNLIFKSDLPFHAYALEKERKVKAVLKGTPLEFETEDIRADLERQDEAVVCMVLMVLIMDEVRNENWSDLMVEILPSHQVYSGLTKALKTEGAVSVPTLRKPDKFVAFDDQEKAECLADDIKEQCSENPPYDFEYVRRVEEEVRHRISLPPKDDLDPIA
ncbi:hypothetical protein EVAR_99731_1 [Eumeta japonica]|uniref:Uncharacterized protein n=1 Tax=Eumeta variegata TaxID=151549 RepID=A0A4C1Z5J7_EUMVA|nr:hypothetical protein EVAR_99731_1 [Eumeta japonica]